MAKPSKLSTSRSHADAENAEATLNRRTAILGTGAVGLFSVLGLRLYNLQVTKAEDYIALSEDNRFNYNIVLPSRGQILDRHGETLAVNQPKYRIILIPERTPDVDETLSLVTEAIGLTDKSKARIKADIKSNPKFVPITLKDNVEWKSFAALNMRMHELPGVVPEVAEGRAYLNNGIFVHTLGYIGRANDRDISRDDDPLLRQPTFRIGKTGVEAAADKKLRGGAGRLKVEVNAMGRIVREWPDPKDSATSGDDVYLTLDAHLQKFAAEQYEEDSGGIAVIDCVTGELRTLLSMPSFDGNLFVNGLTQAQMDVMNNDPRRPQFNKVIGGGYPPASTFKMVVMLAALESKLINPYQKVFCMGKMRLGNRTFHCWKRRGTARLANANSAITPSLFIGDTIPNFEDLDFDPKHLNFVREAMFSVCEEPGGTAYRMDSLGLGGIKMAGKTGTGQVRGISVSERASGVRKNSSVPWELRDHSIFVGFAPYDNPRFAVGTIVEHGGSGAGRAANITRAVLSEALKRDGLEPQTTTESQAVDPQNSQTL